MKAKGLKPPGRSKTATKDLIWINWRKSFTEFVGEENYDSDRYTVVNNSMMIDCSVFEFGVVSSDGSLIKAVHQCSSPDVEFFIIVFNSCHLTQSKSYCHNSAYRHRTKTYYMLVDFDVTKFIMLSKVKCNFNNMLDDVTFKFYDTDNSKFTKNDRGMCLKAVKLWLKRLSLR